MQPRGVCTEVQVRLYRPCWRTWAFSKEPRGFQRWPSSQDSDPSTISSPNFPFYLYCRYKGITECESWEKNSDWRGRGSAQEWELRGRQPLSFSFLLLTLFTGVISTMVVKTDISLTIITYPWVSTGNWMSTGTQPDAQIPRGSSPLHQIAQWSHRPHIPCTSNHFLMS